METRRRHRRGKKRFLLPLSLLCLAVLLPVALLAPSASASSSSSPAAAAGGGSRKRRWAGFDYYVLALQWPGTICRQTSNCCDTNGCCRSKLLKWFTIQTHGTCAYPEIQDEYDYFSTALYLYSKYNVTKALRKAHIRLATGKRYDVGRIVAVIEYAFGAMPSLVCKNGSVQELRLCFHKDYQPRDCTFETDKAPNSRGYCPRYVTFPSYKPSVLTNATEGISDQANGELHTYRTAE
ncbi:Ribonuclease 2 [Dichanthelium oligosanthes]|uniref:Ribonuclease 2 n=1 Tax=Dichanthelium oligosanthes TaxID=888268 RepID=A0A1E5V7P6_9POAL|nr:Ribonuclease 2 [Dichanthelium oligosanthes]